MTTGGWVFVLSIVALIAFMAGTIWAECRIGAKTKHGPEECSGWDAMWWALSCEDYHRLRGVADQLATLKGKLRELGR